MDYREAVAYLDSHIGAGIRPGLERIERLVDLMGDPHRAYPVIHVAGTNGKTSTTRLVSAILTGHGLRVGSTTSPHLEGVEERLALDGVAASPEELAEAVEDIRPFVELFKERYQDSPTYFEITTLLAFSYFASHAVDVAVVEVGLGGRLDATNVVEGKVSVVTGISLEHTEYLGTTIAEIAAEKAAIAKPGTVIVAGDASGGGPSGGSGPRRRDRRPDPFRPRGLRSLGSAPGGRRLGSDVRGRLRHL